MIVLGIDPGLDGAIASISDDCGIEGPTWPLGGVAVQGMVVTVFETPTARDGKRRRYLVSGMKALLNRHLERSRQCVAALERVHAMPKQGVTSSFHFGEGFGLWQGILAGLGIPFDLVEPTRWKKTMLDGRAKEKEASRIRAQELFPGVELHLKKHHGRADALLIAEYRRRLG